MTHRAQSVANARAEAAAHNPIPRATLNDVIASAMYRSMQLDAQYRSSVILAHGAADRAELDALARMCDVPRNVLSFDVAGVR